MIEAIIATIDIWKKSILISVNNCNRNEYKSITTASIRSCWWPQSEWPFKKYKFK